MESFWESWDAADLENRMLPFGLHSFLVCFFHLQAGDFIMKLS